MKSFREHLLFRFEPAPSMGFWTDFKRRFTRGLAALLPALLTVTILLWAYDLVNRTVGQPINRGFVRFLSAFGAPGEEDSPWSFLGIDPVEDAIRYGLKTDRIDLCGRRETIESIALRQPPPKDPEDLEIYSRERRAILWRLAFDKYWLDVLGFGIAIVICYVLGLFVASFIGRTTWRYLESLFKRLPIVKAIYPHVKQITDFLFSEKMAEFGSVIAVQYPCKGIWSIGLQTGGPMDSLRGDTRDDLVSVFMPSSPTPFTGYVIQVPKADTIELPITIDEAIRFIVSGGVIKPSGQAVPGSQGLSQGPPVPFHGLPPAPAAMEKTP